MWCCKVCALDEGEQLEGRYRSRSKTGYCGIGRHRVSARVWWLGPVDEARPGPCDRPMAAAGLTSYRCRNAYGWTMIGARDDDDAMREALRSCGRSRREDLEVWNGSAYVPAASAPAPYVLAGFDD